MIAHRIAAPVLELAGGGAVAGVVGGVVAGAAYLELDGFVIAVTARGVPLLPNAIALAERPARWPRPGAAFTLAPGRLGAYGLEVRWPVAHPPAWDPTLRAAGAAGAPKLPRDSRVDGFALALAARDPARAAVEAAALIGLGPGLTPEGDDLLAGALAAAAALAGPLPGALPHELPTTALSRTLLRLAARGAVMEPVHGLLGPRWEPALRRLERVGHSTGRAYAAGVAAVLSPAP